jgi:ferredoxin
MRISIDSELCMGDRNCNDLCPEVFQYDEEELVSNVLMEVIPAHLEEIVRRCAEECAAGAITITE